MIFTEFSQNDISNEWLLAHATDLHTQLNDLLEARSLELSHVDALLLVFPFFMMTSHQKQWVTLLFETLLYRETQDAHLQRANILLDDKEKWLDFVEEKYTPARRMIRTVLKRARKQIDKDAVMQIYLDLLQNRLLEQGEYVEALMSATVDLARNVNSQVSYGWTYLVMAEWLPSAGKISEAYDLAFGCWMRYAGKHIKQADYQIRLVNLFIQLFEQQNQPDQVAYWQAQYRRLAEPT